MVLPAVSRRQIEMLKSAQDKGPAGRIVLQFGNTKGSHSPRSSWLIQTTCGGSHFADVLRSHRANQRMSIRVHPTRCRQGIGTALFELLRSRAARLQGARLLGWLREDVSDGRSFAARCGFQDTGKGKEEYRLHVPEATTAAYAAAEQRLRREGIRIVALAELGPDDEGFLRALRRLWGHWAGEEVAGGSLAEWRRDMLEGPGQSPEMHWIALRQGTAGGDDAVEAIE